MIQRRWRVKDTKRNRENEEKVGFKANLKIVRWVSAAVLGSECHGYGVNPTQGTWSTMQCDTFRPWHGGIAHLQVLNNAALRLRVGRCSTGKPCQ